MNQPTTAHDVPGIIARYFDAHDRYDIDDAVALFGPNATVIDERQTHHGHDDIGAWLASAGRQYTYTRTPLGAHQQLDGGWIVRNRLDGDFPGGTVELAYRFNLDGDQIATLTIAP
jgi:hypothetical protein